MTTRRGFVTGVLASGLVPGSAWSDIANPAFLSAAQTPDGSYHLFGLGIDGQVQFSQPLPGRGHAGAAHPHRAEAVAFARRPGRFAYVLNCSTGTVSAEIQAPEGRHFCGHGAFSADGSYLYTPENDYGAGQGVIGVWDSRNGYRRVSEFSSRGVGPHDIARLPGADCFVIANGGIETHPETGRTKLNLPTMRPNLSYITGTGDLLETVELDATYRLNSIRHLSVRADGLVAFGMQWQGDKAALPKLVGFHRMGGDLQLADAPQDAVAWMNGYIGSVVFSGDGTQVAVSSPRGGMVQLFDSQTQAFIAGVQAKDVCGVGRGQGGFVMSTGTGEFIALRDGRAVVKRRQNVNWDNHLVPVS